VEVILLHGMCRTRASMLLLGMRLKRAGHRVHFFGYRAATDSLERATARLAELVSRKISPRPYVLAGHSLGSMIIRHATRRLTMQQPRAAYFLAAPMIACRAAKFCARFRIYRMLTGEMGRLLTRDAFMADLPVPPGTRAYVGTAGPRQSWLPFGNALNDGILLSAEASADQRGVTVTVPHSHTLIMNSRKVAADMLADIATLAS